MLLVEFVPLGLLSEGRLGKNIVHVRSDALIGRAVTFAKKYQLRDPNFAQFLCEGFDKRPAVNSVTAWIRKTMNRCSYMGLALADYAYLRHESLSHRGGSREFGRLCHGISRVPPQQAESTQMSFRGYGEQAFVRNAVGTRPDARRYCSSHLYCIRNKSS